MFHAEIIIEFKFIGNKSKYCLINIYREERRHHKFLYDSILCCEF